MACDPFFMGGLDEFSQDYALVWKLLPVKTAESKFKSNYEKIENIFLNKDNFISYESIKDSDIPRISGIMNIYWANLYNLANYCYSKGNTEKVKQIIELTEKYLCVGFQPEREQMYLNAIKKMQ